MNFRTGIVGNQMTMAGMFSTGNSLSAGQKNNALFVKQKQTPVKANKTSAANQMWAAMQQRYSENMRQMKQMLRCNGCTQQNGTQGLFGQKKSIVDDMMGYSDTIRANREKAKKTTLELKKLQYSYTAVSGKILRSKTSASAKQAAGQARREVIRLQQKRNNSDYDQEELEAAITHAKAMERLAKKKARHLEEEELVKVAGGPCAGELEEKEELREEETAREDEEKAVIPEEEYEDTEELTQDDIERMMAEQASDAEIESMTMEEMEMFLDEMQRSMEEVLEESGLNDLMEELTAKAPGEEMDPADYKMMKIKHRCKEMKDLVKADMEYLKVIFKKLEESKGKAIDSLKGMSGGGSSAFAGAQFSGGGMPAVTVHIDIPVSDMGTGASEGASSVDVSV